VWEDTNARRWSFEQWSSFKFVLISVPSLILLVCVCVFWPCFTTSVHALPSFNPLSRCYTMCVCVCVCMHCPTLFPTFIYLFVCPTLRYFLLCVWVCLALPYFQPLCVCVCVSYLVSNLYLNVCVLPHVQLLYECVCVCVCVCPALFQAFIWVCMCVLPCLIFSLYLCVCLAMFPYSIWMCVPCHVSNLPKTWNKTCCPIFSLPKTCYPIFSLPKTFCVLSCFQNCCLLILLLQWSQLVSTCYDPQKFKD